MANPRRPRIPVKVPTRMAAISPETKAAIEATLIPNANRPRGVDAYYHGHDEASWLNIDRTTSSLIRQGRMDATDVSKALNISMPDATRYVDQVLSGRKSNHLALGVPHTQGNEAIMLEALKRSRGIDDAWDNNRVEPTQTDLAAVIGGRPVLIDVQHRYGRDQGYGLLKEMKGRNANVINDVLREAAPSDKLSALIHEMKSRATWHGDDKLLKTRNPEFNDFPDNELQGATADNYTIDYLLGGEYRNVENLTGSRAHGFYDPKAPRNVESIDLNAIRREILGMSLNDLRNTAGINRMTSRGDPRNKDLDRKLRLSIDRPTLQEMGALDRQLIDPEIVRYLNSRA